MRRKRRLVASLALVFCACTALLVKSFTALPALSGRTISSTIGDTAATRLGRTISPLVAAHRPYSGIYTLRDARDAFAARIRMAEAAERSLDVQYYIWRRDMSGMLLLDSLRRAADRGVRVRLLLDDNNTSGLDDLLAALDSHPNVEVRLFNPFVIRGARPLGYVTDFRRLNRRMHNKSFTADNQATIVGGRNVGDEYFGATDGLVFADLDVIAVGPIVGKVSADFDRYWSSGSSYPIDRLVPTTDVTLSDLAAEASRLRAERDAVAYLEALRVSSFTRQIDDRTLPLEWCTTIVISDDPAKALGRERPDTLLFEQFKVIFGQPQKTLDLVSPYFVPGETGTEMFRAWAAAGVKVRILTNSLEATDVAAVHAGYAKRRRSLLEGGITLFELRRGSAAPRTRGSPVGAGSGWTASSGSSLHAKTFAVDGLRVFIGSFNFDPRSARLNTEMGFVIDSPAIANRIRSAFDRTVPSIAYEVRRSRAGRLYWIERRDKESLRLDAEPGTTLRRRAAIWILEHLPLEWLL